MYNMNNLPTFSFSSKSIAYLEKHRVYELLRELIHRMVHLFPEKPLVFLKAELVNIMTNHLNPTKIMLLVPPRTNIDKEWLSQQIMERLGVMLISRSKIITSYIAIFGDMLLDTDRLAYVVYEMVKADPIPRTGWIMIDHPQTLQEALSLQKIGILPDYTIYLKHCPVDYDSFSESQMHRILELQNVFRSTVKEINVDGCNPNGIVSACCEAVQAVPFLKTFLVLPTVYRVVLFAPPSCGVHQQAVELGNHFKLVTVDFEYLLCQAALRNDCIGERLRNNTVSFSDLQHILYTKLREKDCMEGGWILINFPRTVEEFQILDNFETPPNRVVFFNIDEDLCKAKIMNRNFGELSKYSGMAEKKVLEKVYRYFLNETALKDCYRKMSLSIDATKSAGEIQMRIHEGIMLTPAADVHRKVFG